jgi:excisionase family DNA binding protein
MDTFFTIEETATRCRVSVFTVRRWVNANKLQAKKVGRRWLVPESALNAYLGADKPQIES